MAVTISEYSETVTWRQASCDVCGWHSARTKYPIAAAPERHEVECARWQNAGIRPVWVKQHPAVGHTCEKQVNYFERVSDGARISIHERHRKVYDDEGKSVEKLFLEMHLTLGGDWVHPIEVYEVEQGWMDAPPWRKSDG
jgi:hypothetical protein